MLVSPFQARTSAPALVAARRGGVVVGLTTSAARPHIPDMVRIAISQAAFNTRSLLALLMILLAAPACAESRFRGFHASGGFHGFGFPAFHHRGGRVLGFFGGYLCGYNCGLGFYNPGYGYFNGYGYGYFNGDGYGNGYFNGYGYFNGKGYFNGYGYSNGYGYGNGAGNAASISNVLTGGYVPDRVGADIPPRPRAELFSADVRREPPWRLSCGQAGCPVYRSQPLDAPWTYSCPASESPLARAGLCSPGHRPPPLSPD